MEGLVLPRISKSKRQKVKSASKKSNFDESIRLGLKKRYSNEHLIKEQNKRTKVMQKIQEDMRLRQFLGKEDIKERKAFFKKSASGRNVLVIKKDEKPEDFNETASEIEDEIKNYKKSRSDRRYKNRDYEMNNIKGLRITDAEEKEKDKGNSKWKRAKFKQQKQGRVLILEELNKELNILYNDDKEIEKLKKRVKKYEKTNKKKILSSINSKKKKSLIKRNKRMIENYNMEENRIAKQKKHQEKQEHEKMVRKRKKELSLAYMKSKNKTRADYEKRLNQALFHKEWIKRTIQEAERTEKWSFIISLGSRLNVIRKEIELKKEKEAKIRKEKELSSIIFERMMPVIINERRKNWKNAVHKFKQYFYFFRLWSQVKKKKEAVIIIKTYLSSSGFELKFVKRIEEFKRNIKKTQFFLKKYNQVTNTRIMVNVLNYTICEAKMILDYELDSNKNIYIEGENINGKLSRPKTGKLENLNHNEIRRLSTPKNNVEIVIQEPDDTNDEDESIQRPETPNIVYKKKRDLLPSKIRSVSEVSNMLAQSQRPESSSSRLKRIRSRNIEHQKTNRLPFYDQFVKPHGSGCICWLRPNYKMRIKLVTQFLKNKEKEYLEKMPIYFKEMEKYQDLLQQQKFILKANTLLKDGDQSNSTKSQKQSLVDHTGNVIEKPIMPFLRIFISEKEMSHLVSKGFKMVRDNEAKRYEQIKGLPKSKFAQTVKADNEQHKKEMKFLSFKLKQYFGPQFKNHQKLFSQASKKYKDIAKQRKYFHTCNTRYDQFS